MIRAMEGLDEETKTQKIIELKRLMDAQIIDEEEEQEAPVDTKAVNFNYKEHKLEVEKDFTSLALKVARKLKAEKKQKHFLAFLKKLNLNIAKEFTIEMTSDLLESIKVIKNKKKKEDKKDGKTTTKTTGNKNINSGNVRMDMDVNVEVNPDYKPRNHAMYEDFM